MRRLSPRLLFGCLLLAAASSGAVFDDAMSNTQGSSSVDSPAPIRVVPIRTPSIRDRIIEIPRPSVGRVPGARPA